MPLAASTAMPERLAPRASIHSGDVAKQMPDLHTSHARPTKPGEHAHWPGATHAPWPEQSLGQTGSLQLAPRQPAKQRFSRKVAPSAAELTLTHAPCSTSPQSASAQLAPPQPASHLQLPALRHSPRPLQSSGQTGSAQLGPVQPTPQLHTGNGPARHGPWPLQLSLQPGRSHAAPDQPARHWQTPGEAQMPCRLSMWHACGQMGSEQRAPFQPV